MKSVMKLMMGVFSEHIFLTVVHIEPSYILEHRVADFCFSILLSFKFLSITSGSCFCELVNWKAAIEL